MPTPRQFAPDIFSQTGATAPTAPMGCGVDRDADGFRPPIATPCRRPMAAPMIRRAARCCGAERSRQRIPAGARRLRRLEDDGGDRRELSVFVREPEFRARPRTDSPPPRPKMSSRRSDRSTTGCPAIRCRPTSCWISSRAPTNAAPPRRKESRETATRKPACREAHRLHQYRRGRFRTVRRRGDRLTAPPSTRATATRAVLPCGKISTPSAGRTSHRQRPARRPDAGVGWARSAHREEDLRYSASS